VNMEDRFYDESDDEEIDVNKIEVRSKLINQSEI
jgi:hypothetical protein